MEAQKVYTHDPTCRFEQKRETKHQAIQNFKSRLKERAVLWSGSVERFSEAVLWSNSVEQFNWTIQLNKPSNRLKLTDLFERFSRSKWSLGVPTFGFVFLEREREVESLRQRWSTESRSREVAHGQAPFSDFRTCWREYSSRRRAHDTKFTIRCSECRQC